MHNLRTFHCMMCVGFRRRIDVIVAKKISTKRKHKTLSPLSSNSSSTETSSSASQRVVGVEEERYIYAENQISWGITADADQEVND